MIQAIWIALFIFLSTLVSVAYGADRPIAMVLASLRNPETGSLDFALMEKEFDQAMDSELRFSLARMLMSAPAGDLSRPPYYYANYVLPKSDSIRVRRLAADGAFEEADLSVAKELYFSIIQDPRATDEDREYSVFKLGWVYLNLEKPEEAFALWAQQIMSGAKGDLQETLIYDAGRALGEAIARARTVSVPAEMVATEAFLDGVSLGIKRNRSINRSHLRDQIDGMPFYSALLMRWMKEQNGMVPPGCDSIPWLEKAQENLDVETTKKYLSRCVRDMEAGKAPRYFWTPKLKPIYMTMPLSGLDRWPRARALELVGASQEACVEYAGAFRDVLGQAAPSDSKDVVGELFFSVASSCKGNTKLMESVISEVLASGWLRENGRASGQVLEWIALNLARSQTMEQLRERWEIIGAILEKEPDFAAYQLAVETEVALKDVSFSGVSDGELELILSEKVMSLKRSVQTSAKHKWKFSGFLKAADQSLGRAGDSLVNALERLGGEKSELRDTLVALTKEVRKWRIQ